jgi:hypothetical protein
MRSPRRVANLACALLTATLGVSSSAQFPLLPLDQLMQHKLEHGQSLLEAVVLEHYADVERYAYELILLSETSTWSPLQTAEYLHYAAEFRGAASALMDEARNRHIDGIPSAYAELVATCIQCHTHLRGSQRAN